MSDELRVSIIARRGIEQMKEGIYAEAQQQFEAALKLDRSNSWVYYNLGLLFLEQRNWQQALDTLEASLGPTSSAATRTMRKANANAPCRSTRKQWLRELTTTTRRPSRRNTWQRRTIQRQRQRRTPIGPGIDSDY
jgi:tetratricopeptide (TPR) repeat protein